MKVKEKAEVQTEACIEDKWHPQLEIIREGIP